MGKGEKMAEKLIRVGKISSIDAATGMAKVTYPDMDDAVTADFPILTFNEEYMMPEVGESVLVLHLSNGVTEGVILGTFWNLDEHYPDVTGENVFRKELSKKFGQAYLSYNDGTTCLKGPSVRLTCNSGSATCAQILDHFSRLATLEGVVYNQGLAIGALQEALDAANAKIAELETKV